MIRILKQIIVWYGKPKQIRVDDGPEFTLIMFETCAMENNIKLEFIKLGCPYQNSFTERFNRIYCEEVLDLYLFESLQEVRKITDEWLDIYN